MMTDAYVQAAERYERERLAWDAWTLGEGSWDDMPRPPVRPYPYRSTRQQRNRRISTCHGVTHWLQWQEPAKQGDRPMDPSKLNRPQKPKIVARNGGDLPPSKPKRKEGLAI